jgi:hypothetical protein
MNARSRLRLPIMPTLHRFLLPLPLFTLLAGCSDPATKPLEVPDDSCKNVIAYEFSGKPDLTATHRYDDGGHLTEYVETNDSDTEVFRLSRTYDMRGRLETQVVDTTRFNTGHREMTWEYDDQDRVVRTTYDGWSTPPQMRESRYFYDAMGRRDRTETDEDGVPSDRTQYVYIEGEPFIIEEQHKSGPDGAVFYGFRYFLAQGRWLERMEIFNIEVVQAAEWYTYKDVSKGLVSRRDFDGNGDNLVEEVGSYFWNAYDRMERAEYDTNVDGTVDQAYTYEYDALGRMLKREWIVDDQGHLEFVTTFTWSDNGLEHVERADALTGGVIEAWSFTRGCPGDLPMNVAIAPIQGFRYEMQTLPVEVDSSTWWRSYDML